MDMTGKYGRSFAGKVGVVTGGSRGIGEGIVRRLASHGAAVAFTYFNSDEKAKRLASEIDAAGGKALPIKADSAYAARTITANIPYKSSRLYLSIGPPYKISTAFSTHSNSSHFSQTS